MVQTISGIIHETFINEGIRIKNKDEKSLLNSKAEYYGPSVKRKSFVTVTHKCKSCYYKTDKPDQLERHIQDIHIHKKLQYDQNTSTLVTCTLPKRN